MAFRRKTWDAGLPDLRRSASAEVIRIPSMGEWWPDVLWVHTDPAGHEHRFNADGQLDTLDAQDNEWYDLDGEEHYDTTYRCKLCRAEVAPRWLYVPASGFVETIPGPVSYMIGAGDETFDVTEERYRAFVAAVNDQDAERVWQILDAIGWPRVRHFRIGG